MAYLYFDFDLDENYSAKYGFILFILPHLKYRSPLLLGVGEVQANKIEGANHYILRTLTGQGKSLPYQELLNIYKGAFV